MIYSEPLSNGRYGYWDVPLHGIAAGNDLPVPSLSPASSLGVPSVEAGRAVPAGAGAKFIGQGDQALGVVAPMQRDQLGMNGGFSLSNGTVLFLGGVALGLGVMWAFGRGGRR